MTTFPGMYSFENSLKTLTLTVFSEIPFAFIEKMENTIAFLSFFHRTRTDFMHLR